MIVATISFGEQKLNHLIPLVAALVCILWCGVASVAQTPSRKHNLTRTDRAAWHSVLKWPQDCEEAFQKTYDSMEDFAGLDFYRLGRSQYLVGVACYSGAYQPGSIFIYYDEAKPSSARSLRLKGFDSQDDKGHPLDYSEVDGSATFNDKTKVLELFSNYRGPGDCGRLVRYRFVRGQPVVIEAREQDCDDESIRRPTDPRHWPRVRLSKKLD